MFTWLFLGLGIMGDFDFGGFVFHVYFLNSLQFFLISPKVKGPLEMGHFMVCVWG